MNCLFTFLIIQYLTIVTVNSFSLDQALLKDIFPPSSAKCVNPGKCLECIANGYFATSRLLLFTLRSGIYAC